MLRPLVGTSQGSSICRTGRAAMPGEAPSPCFAVHHLANNDFAAEQAEEHREEQERDFESMEWNSLVILFSFPARKSAEYRSEHGPVPSAKELQARLQRPTTSCAA